MTDSPDTPTAAADETPAVTPAEHPNAMVMREFFAAFGAADRDRLGELRAADLVWHFPGHSPISGDWHGVDGLVDGIRAILDRDVVLALLAVRLGRC